MRDIFDTVGSDKLTRFLNRMAAAHPGLDWMPSGQNVEITFNGQRVAALEPAGSRDFKLACGCDGSGGTCTCKRTSNLLDAATYIEDRIVSAEASLPGDGEDDSVTEAEKKASEPADGAWLVWEEDRRAAGVKV